MKNGNGKSKAGLLQGNEACAIAAIEAGCRFFAGYPITPSTEIAEWMSDYLPRLGGRFIQMEDEIASISALIGASIAGRKSMTSTSGPGFSLMQEALGFAVMAEIPCVIVNVQRGGPSTGLPTKPAQADVLQARWGTHGDHPMIVLTASSVEDCFNMTVKAFNYAEKYRNPVVLLIDEVVGHMREKIHIPNKEDIEVWNRIKPNVPPEWYYPYERTHTDVPPMANFGEGYRYHITGLTHDSSGFPTEVPHEVKSKIKRIHRKILKATDDISICKEFKTEDAKIVIISYGISARCSREAVIEARKLGFKAGMLEINSLWPAPAAQIQKVFNQADAVIVPELNMGQYVRTIARLNPGHVIIEPLNKVTGEIFTVEEILKKIKEIKI